jgi:hypothetical protein
MFTLKHVGTLKNKQLIIIEIFIMSIQLKKIFMNKKRRKKISAFLSAFYIK